MTIFQAVAMSILGVIAGCTNENTAAGMLLMCMLFPVYYKTEKRRIPVWAYAGLIGALAGYTFMITAPGNAVRSREVEMGLFTLVHNFFWHTQVFLNTLGLFNAVVIALAVYLYKMHSEKYTPVVCLLLIYITGVLVSTYAMVLSPFFPTRAWFGIIVFNIIALGLLVVNAEIRAIRPAKYGFVILGLLVFMFNSYDVYKDVNHVEQKQAEREQIIQAGIEAQKDTIVIPIYQTRTKYALRDAEYAAPLLSRYYGVQIIFE
jgi:drug/metabolite transporter (DMT)-like permease